jgi:uncharacterized phage protein (TIGR02218 family)
MKTLPTALAEHYASGSTTVATALRIERKDGSVFAFTSGSDDAVIDGETYISGPGLDLSGMACSAGFAVDNLELTVFPDPVVLTRDSFLAGLWQGARFLLFEYNWADISMGRNVLKRGWLGESRLQAEAVVVELRSLRQALQQQVGEQTTKTCRNRLGDALCKVDLSPLTHSGAVASSPDRYTLTGLSAVDDYYTEGFVTFSTGRNAGVARKVRKFASNVFELATPLPFPADVGDLFPGIGGCQKRLQDCRDRFSNVPNFGGEPHLPGIDALTAYPIPGEST